jgi:negative regulator of sigma E activity
MNGQDKVLDHTREQLSALFDGELALDEARFLERRLQHDAALAGCVSRWQAIGDAMRGQAEALAPAGFPERVAAAVAAEAMPLPAARPAGRLLRRSWMPGAALAASVALVALFATRQVADQPDGEAPAAQVAQAAVPDAASTSAPATPARVPAQPAPQVPGHEAAQLAAAVAVAEVPRRAAARRAPASRGQAQRAAATRAARAADAQPQFAVAAVGTPANALPPAVQGKNPFAPAEAASQQAVASRPWPRALLPSAGTFNVGYGNLQSGNVQDVRDAFHPFRPRTAAAAAAAATAQAPQDDGQHDDAPAQ